MIFLNHRKNHFSSCFLCICNRLFSRHNDMRCNRLFPCRNISADTEEKLKEIHVIDIDKYLAFLLIRISLDIKTTFLCFYLYTGAISDFYIPWICSFLPIFPCFRADDTQLRYSCSAIFIRRAKNLSCFSSKFDTLFCSCVKIYSASSGEIFAITRTVCFPVPLL